MNRLKQTEEVGLLIHAILLADIRTVSISDAADGSKQGGFMVGFTTPEFHQRGFSCYVDHVLVFAQGEVKGLCIPGS